MNNNRYCAPNVDIKSHYTCFEREELEGIAEAFNKWINESKKNECNKKGECIVRKMIKIKGKTKEELWRSIYKRLNMICKYEYCWLDQRFIEMIPDRELKEKIKFFTYKPKATIKKRSWLSTVDINNVLQQYQEVDKMFNFLGALPSDFYTQVKYDEKEIFKYKRSAIVFNLDKHDEKGSHWVAFYIDNDNKTLEYFDSLGEKPNKNIKNYIDKIKSYVPKYKILINKYVHQRKNSECGVYAIYYILQRLLGKSFEEIVKKKMPDEKISILREYIFRPR
jgi:hypothetical protein